MSHQRIQKLLYEYVRGELDQLQARVVEEHLAGCDSCFAECQIIRETLRLLPARTRKPSEDRSDAFWQQFVDSVDDAVRAKRNPRPVVSPVWDQLWSMLAIRRPAVIVAGALAIVVVATALWTLLPVGQEPSRQTTEIVAGIPSDSLRVELAGYLRKSKILLVGISNISADRGERVDLSVERQEARNLVRQARYFDNRLSDERARQLVIALERILLELATIEQQADVPAVEIVRSGINQENMLFKIRMAETEYGLPDNRRFN